MIYRINFIFLLFILKIHDFDNHRSLRSAMGEGEKGSVGHSQRCGVGNVLSVNQGATRENRSFTYPDAAV